MRGNEKGALPRRSAPQEQPPQKRGSIVKQEQQSSKPKTYTPCLDSIESSVWSMKTFLCPTEKQLAGEGSTPKELRDALQCVRIVLDWFENRRKETKSINAQAAEQMLECASELLRRQVPIDYGPEKYPAGHPAVSLLNGIEKLHARVKCLPGGSSPTPRETNMPDRFVDRAHTRMKAFAYMDGSLQEVRASLELLILHRGTLSTRHERAVLHCCIVTLKQGMELPARNARNASDGGESVRAYFEVLELLESAFDCAGNHSHSQQVGAQL